MTLTPELQARLAQVTLLALDCDGVLTNGELYYDEDGHRWLAFYARDGLGLGLVCRAGIEVAVISGRPADIAERRHRELGVKHFLGPIRDKGAALRQLCADLGTTPEHSAFVGDDIPDLGGFAAAGVRIAVADADPELRRRADWVTTAPGGRGAVREVCEALLRARGAWDGVLKLLGG